jgi:hypothetical protein
MARSEAAGYQIYPARWVYTAKDAYTAEACQVVLGNIQADDHYYSPTATSASFRTFCQVIAHEDLETERWDVNQAVL